MKLMSRFFLIIALILTILPISASGKVEVSADRETYNLGNSMMISASVISENDFKGRFSLLLVCNKARFPIYNKEVNIEKGFRTADALVIKASKDMSGECSIEGSLINDLGDKTEESISKSISIVNNLDISPAQEYLNALPGSKIIVRGSIVEKSGLMPQNPLVHFRFNGQDYGKNATGGNFSFELEIPNEFSFSQRMLRFPSVHGITR